VTSPAPSFRRGINLGNRLDAPREGDWGATLHDTDFAHVASRPFDHIRLPVRFSAHAGTTPPYALDETFMNRVDWALDQALSRGLSVVLDLHHYVELHQDPAGHADRFLALWGQIAQRYADQPAAVAFELLNEPADALVSSWNELAARAVAVVRSTNPSRLIIVDTAPFAAADSLSQLALPADPNVMASVHTYDPVRFSLQGGRAWGAGPAFDTLGIVYPGPPATPVTPRPGPRRSRGPSRGWPHTTRCQQVRTPAGPRRSPPRCPPCAATRKRQATPSTAVNGTCGTRPTRYRACVGCGR
jgi:endoglucanase